MLTDPTADAMSLMTQYVEEVVVRKAAFDTVDTPLVPPDVHVLDHLARARDLVDPDSASMRPTARIVACPVEEIDCDICDAPARYETHLRDRGRRILAYVCLDCMRTHGERMLGAGLSTYLMYAEETPAAVRRVCDELCARAAEAASGPTARPAGNRSVERSRDHPTPSQLRLSTRRPSPSGCATSG